MRSARSRRDRTRRSSRRPPEPVADRRTPRPDRRDGGRRRRGAANAPTPLDRADDVEHRRAHAGAYVDLDRRAAGAEVLQRLQVRIGEVVDVDVVADAGAVGRVVVGAEHPETVAVEEGCLHRQRDQVDTEVPVLADAAIGAGAGGQRRALRAMYRTCGHPDCTVKFSACTAHHVRWWWRDLGPTDRQPQGPAPTRAA